MTEHFFDVYTPPAAGGAFPQVSVLYAFTGSDDTTLPTYNAEWKDVANAFDWEIISNQAQGTTTGACSNYTDVVASLPANFDVTFDLSGAALPSVDGQVVVVIVNTQGETDLATMDGYLVGISNSGGTNHLVVVPFNNGSGGAAICDVTPTISLGDSVGIRKVGSSIALWHKPVAGAWTEVDTGSDATYSGGKIGIIAAGFDSGGIDNLSYGAT